MDLRGIVVDSDEMRFTDSVVDLRLAGIYSNSWYMLTTVVVAMEINRLHAAIRVAGELALWAETLIIFSAALYDLPTSAG